MIPTLTKEDIFSIKDINTISTLRNLNETAFDEMVTQLNSDAQGYCKGMILQDYHQYITTEAWRNIIKLYVQWQMMTQGYSEIPQILATNAYNQLNTLLKQMNDNFSMQAKNIVTPNRQSNFRIINLGR